MNLIFFLIVHQLDCFWNVGSFFGRIWPFLVGGWDTQMNNICSSNCIIPLVEVEIKVSLILHYHLPEVIHIVFVDEKFSSLRSISTLLIPIKCLSNYCIKLIPTGVEYQHKLPTTRWIIKWSCPNRELFTELKLKQWKPSDKGHFSEVRRVYLQPSLGGDWATRLNKKSSNSPSFEVNLDHLLQDFSSVFFLPSECHKNSTWTSVSPVAKEFSTFQIWKSIILSPAGKKW